MKKFKCSLCGCDNAHTIKRFFKDGKDALDIEDMVQLRSPMADSIIVLRACSKCGTVRADWEKMSESNRVSDEDKGKVKEIQDQYKKGGKND